MREPFIFLRPNVTREYASALIDWLRDEEVMRYLNEQPDIVDDVMKAVDRCSLPELTHLFSRRGRFYMICRGDGAPAGFARLTKRGDETEIVIVIGDKNHWGKRMGYCAIRECMRVAFFELRAKKMIANIHRENGRSLRAFLNARFHVEKETAFGRRLTITLEEYIRLYGQGVFIPDFISITDTDRSRLNELMQGRDEGKPDASLHDLREEICRAKIVTAQEIPGDVVTMRSRAVLLMDDIAHIFMLAYPEEADVGEGRLSVLSPVGTAILGYSEGDTIFWRIPEGEKKIHIKELLYQPEAAGQYGL